MKKYWILLIILVFTFYLAGCDTQSVKEHTHTYSEDWSFDNTYHYHQCTFAGCTAKYKQGKHQLDNNGVCKVCGWDSINNKEDEKEEIYVVIFKDEDGTELKKQPVKKGKDAIAPENPTKEGYLFAGWDKNYTNVTQNLIVTATYNIIKDYYDITYDFSNAPDGLENWGYQSKHDMTLAFLKDFYEFLNPTESLIDFIYANDGSIDGTWKQYIGGDVGGSNELLYENSNEEINDGYFFNSTKYKEKWTPLYLYAKDVICGQNKRFGGNNYYYGALDFYRYISNDPYQYIEFYGGNEGFYGFPQCSLYTEENQPLSKYQYCDQTYQLPTLLTCNFIGWMDQYGNMLTEIKEYSCIDYTLKAVFKEEETYTIKLNVNGGSSVSEINLKKGSTIELPKPTKEGYIFLGWYLNDVKFSATEFLYDFDIELLAKWRDENEVELENLNYDGTNVTYRKTSTVVQIPTDYVQKSTQFRGVWVSSYAGDFDPSTDKDTMKKNLTEVLDICEYYNLNAVVFHIRTHNQAFYRTKMTYISSEYGTYESFGEWDYLTWFIEECHKRNIEFHAWLNPYRINNSGTTIEEVVNKWKDYPDNPASNADNLLYSSKNGYVILDPAIPEVRDYIVDICTEIMENYDVDAIHFDDYFYMDGIDDSASRTKYNTLGLSTDNFRRQQVDSFIEQLSTAMHEFNVRYNKHVQLGISPTGIYRNGDGTVEKGSNTSGYAHYGSPLYADTYKWIKNGWIDYILPQSYWAITHKSAGYADVMDWWNLACAGTGVNLYSGVGIYMSLNGGNYSWGSQAYEVSNQILYTTKLENCQGVCFYQFRTIKTIYNDSTQIQYKGLERIRTEYWTSKVPTPSTMSTNYTYKK